MIVIVLSNCPDSLRGDMTKWFHETSVNVYVGRVSARIRDELWERISTTLKEGSAVMVFSANNEQGFNIRTIGGSRTVEDYDGLLLMTKPKTQTK